MRKDISLQFVTTASGLIILWIGEQMKTLPDFVTNIFLALGIILLVIGILGLTGIWDKLVKRLKTQPATSRLSPIEHVEHGKRPLTVLSLFWVLFFSLLLTVGLWIAYLWGTRMLPVELSISTIVVPVVYIILPTYNLADIFFMKRKYFRLTHSSAIKDADFVVDGNASRIFDDCRRILLAMNTTIIKAKPLKLLKARLGKSKITVEIKHRKDLKVNVYVASDTPLIGKYDGINNQENIDAFTNMLYQSMLKM